MTELKLLRLPEVILRTGLSRSSIYLQFKIEDKAKAFPSPVKIGSHSVAWRESEIEEWIASRKIVEPKKHVKK